MARLDPAARAELPDRVFAYIDSHGKRRLPLHDPAHVRNALARFGQVQFEDDAARERARMRLLGAAKRFRIVPVGFIAGQLRSERASAAPPARTGKLPSGFVTMLMTDIEGSTALVHRLGERYRDLIDDVWALLRHAVAEAGGHEVEARADEFFACFEDPRAAVEAAVAMQRALADRVWPEGVEVRVRIGIHSGYPTSTATNYIGLDVHTTSRLCCIGHGGQILASANTREGAQVPAGDALRFRRLGSYRLRGIPDELVVYQVGATGLRTRFPPLRTS